MNVQVTIRHSKASPSLRDSIAAELQGLEKYADGIISCHAVIDSEHVDKTVEIVVNLSRHTVSAKAQADNLGKAVDMALKKIAAQLRKVNQKRKNHQSVSHEMRDVVSAE